MKKEENCTLDYIPSQLKTCEKPIIDNFEVGEALYRRCTVEELQNPFRNITIGELSHNRKGLKSNILSTSTWLSPGAMEYPL